MALTVADIKARYSGGLTNSDPAASLGGVMSEEDITSDEIGNLFGEVLIPEAAAGSVKYRCFYYTNTSGADTLEDAVVHIESQTASATSSVKIGLDPAGVGDGVSPAAIETGDEESAPTGVTFLDYPTSGAGLLIGDLGPGEAIAVWIERTINTNSSTPLNDEFTLRLEGIPS